MKKFEIVHVEESNEVRDVDTQEVIFSTLLPEYIAEYVDYSVMDKNVVEQVVEIWNKESSIDANLFSGGLVDEYLLNEGLCTQDEREIIVESLFEHSENG